ncbi:Nuclear exosome regulator NRDE2 [Linum perenne]
MEKGEEGSEPAAAAKPSSLFPLFAAAAVTTPLRHDATTTAAAASASELPPQPPQWLQNVSFTADVRVINEAVTSSIRQDAAPEDGSDSESEERRPDVAKPTVPKYELVEEEDSDVREGKAGARYDSTDSEGRKKKRKKKKEKGGSKRKRSEDRYSDFGSRKSNVRDWVDSDAKPAKDYYFDGHGDRDNLAYGSLYRMDVPRYKPYSTTSPYGVNMKGVYRFNKKGTTLDADADVDVLDTKLKSDGRYWSPKYAALVRNKNLKRLRFLAPTEPEDTVSDDFIPLLDSQVCREDEDDQAASTSNSSIVEESWDDEMLRKTRDFNRATREHPHNEKAWLDFAEFQDKVASMQPQKGARLQTLEKKVSILEKASELNPDNEELLLCLLKAYQRRDNADVLMGRWERVLMHHSGSCKLWKEYLNVVRGEFSRFKVSELRKMYAHAIQALSTACSKQFRQVDQNAKPTSTDPAILQLELGLVDIFVSLCRFEWQAGYQELATALFQAEIEFSLFCPSLLLSENAKLRLFEHFWNSDAPRVGEEGAVGWSTWLEKEEENRQRILKEEMSREEESGGWTGWSEPRPKHQETGDVEIINNFEGANEENQEENEDGDNNQEDDIEALLKKLGIDTDAEATGEVKNSSTWARWSEEELLRDSNQWLPVHGKQGVSSGTSDGEDDEQLLRIVMFEDINGFLVSINSREALLSLVSQFVEFFGGYMPQGFCTNSSSWTEQIQMVESLPDSISQNLKGVTDVLVKPPSLAANSLEFLLGGAGDSSKRTDMMKFLRNAILLCLSSFPRNHKLEEAALLAEELSTTKTGSSTPCRALAKTLLKSDRQDLLLCGVYARREAAFGNIDHARRVFDMALSSIEGLQVDFQSSSSLLYFWYAEMELTNSDAGNDQEPSRALHILSCLGSGTSYSRFQCKPSSLQLLRARQGFKERLKTVRSSWVRGSIDDHTVAVTCSAALFEELTSGWTAGVEILDEAFTMVLPERRSQSRQLEFLFTYYVNMLLRHHNELNFSRVWQTILKGLQTYPSNPELFKTFVEIGNLYTTPNKLRLMFDDYSHKKSGILVWLFALSFEMARDGTRHRVHGLFERALEIESLHSSVVLWRMYISYEINIACNLSSARRIFFRAIHACPWSKKLWLDGFRNLKSILTVKELSDLQDVMREKELNLRTDIYEILLQEDEIV